MDHTLGPIRQSSTRGATLPVSLWCLSVCLLGELLLLLLYYYNVNLLILFISHLFAAIFFLPILDLTPLSPSYDI